MDMTEGAAWTFIILITGLSLFQIALAAGAPLGRFAWGGAQARPPARLRLASLLATPLYAGCAVIVLDRAGLADPVPDAISSPGAWVIAALLSLGVVMNALSRSLPERLTMTPLALILAVCAWSVAAA
jgi:hypothetical protein